MRVLLSVLFVALLPSCGRMERARECRRLTGLVNTALDNIERGQRDGPARVGVYDDIARSYDRLAQDLGEFKSKEKDLAPVVTEYQGLARSAGQTVLKAAAAMRFGNPIALAEARAELANHGQQQQALNRQIEQVCRAP
jgi:hypothetical protein